MGLFDFFRGSPSPERFAQMFIKALRRAGVGRPIEYDVEGNRLLVGEGKDRETINLVNFRKEYLQQSRSKRARHLAERARLFSNQREDVASDFDEAREHLRPKLWMRAALEQMRLQVDLDGGEPDKFDIPEYEVGSHLVASLVYDMPQMMQSLNTEQLTEWGVTYYEAMEIARENLEQVPTSYAKIGDGCYAFMTGDSYDACRLLLPSLVDRLEVKGDMVAMVPNRDALLVTGSDDEMGLTIMADLAEKALEDPRPMVPIPLRRDGEDWVDWQPPASHPAAKKLRDMERRFMHETYGEQKQLMERLNDRDEVGIFVASYSVAEKKDGKQFSYAVWSNGVHSLLPRAEWVMFVRGEDDIAAIAPWAKVEQVVGRLMKPTSDYPPRFEVDEFPTDAELVKLGKGEP